MTPPKILMYHSIVTSADSVPQNREIGADLYDVPLENFQKQMDYIHYKGFSVVTMDTFEQDFHSQEEQIIMTFDDGEMNNFTYALPILQKLGYKAYFFVIAKRIGKAGYMGWNELRQMQSAGMLIGSHGLSHEILTNLLDTQVEEELRASKKHLELNLDCSVESLSIPRGFCNNKIIKMAHDLGYKHVFISNKTSDLKEPCFERIAIRKKDHFEKFQNVITGKASWKDMSFERLKSGCKSILPESFYNFIRNSAIRILK